MPNFNNAPFLREAIESVLNQSFSNFIFYIIDDGSTDESTKIIESYNDVRIILIKKTNNTGIVETLNIGLEQIRTKYFIRMDGDDISFENRFKILVDYMEANPEIGVCGTHSQVFGNINEIWKQELNPNKILAKLIYCSAVTHGPSIYRTKVFIENKIFYRDYYPQLEDYDLFFRLKNLTKFRHIDFVLYGYRLLNHNVTVINRSTQNIRYKEIYKEVLEELKIDRSEENLKLHLEYFLNEPITFKIKDLSRYRQLILSQNRKLKIYPEIELEEILEEKWQSIFFKVSELNSIKILTYLFNSRKISINNLIYLLKLKINKWTRRKVNKNK